MHVPECTNVMISDDTYNYWDFADTICRKNALQNFLTVEENYNYVSYLF